jgi:hypothetical protein
MACKRNSYPKLLQIYHQLSVEKVSKYTNKAISAIVKCSEVLQCNYGIINKVSNIFRRHIDNRKLLLICNLLLSHFLIFFRFLFYKYMVVFLFNTAIYVFLLEEAMYSYCCLCILIVSLCILIVVYVFILLFMHS